MGTQLGITNILTREEVKLGTRLSEDKHQKKKEGTEYKKRKADLTQKQKGKQTQRQDTETHLGRNNQGFLYHTETSK